MPPKMSLEAALDEERREILDILEGRTHAAQPAQRARHASPAPPVRSMLDVPDAGSQRHGSIAGIGVGVTQPPNRPTANKPNVTVRSMLEPLAPSPLRLTQSATTSPISATAPSHDGAGDSSRRASDSSNKTLPEVKKKADITEEYQFEMLPSIPNHALPKRVTQGGKLGPSHHHSSSSGHTNSMAAVMSGGDYGPLPGSSRGRSAGRHNSLPGKSRSPSTRRLGRSQSPGTRLLNNNSLNLMSTPGKFVTDSGKVINMEHAYRRLSNAAILKAGGSLSQYPTKAGRGDGDSLSDADVRLQKDYYSDTPDGGFSEENSSDEGESSSGEDEWKTEVNRGRRRIRKKSDSEVSDENDRTKQAKSLMAAAEEERKRMAGTYKVKSLLEPVRNRAASAASEKPMNKRTCIHPHTSFDVTASAGTTPVGSEDEAEFSDIKKAQNLSVYMSPIDQSVPNRLIRTIIRGDFNDIEKEAEEGHRRLRKYLVATDLSDESVYALEWTIGTILRDGDTMYAVFAVDEEAGSESSAINISDGTRAAQDITSTVGSQTEKTLETSNRTSVPSTPQTSSTHLVSDSGGGSSDSRALSKVESDRFRAIDDISQTCVRLLRKTRLQVRLAVEVIHCKSPKHLITEAIDALEPTLVVLGSRGRSALKGVLLGSFSNYIVTKSSVPVMVARKKLRKHAKYKNTKVRLSNNLTTPKKLAQAKID